MSIYLYPFNWVGSTVTGYDETSTIREITISSKTPFRHYSWIRFVREDYIVNKTPPIYIESPEKWIYIVETEEGVDAIVVPINGEISRIHIDGVDYIDDLEYAVRRMSITRQFRWTEGQKLSNVADIDVRAYYMMYNLDIQKPDITSADKLIEFCEANNVITNLIMLAELCGVRIEDYLLMSDIEIAEIVCATSELEIEEEQPATIDDKMEIINLISQVDERVAIVCFSLPLRICMAILYSDFIDPSQRSKLSFWRDPVKRGRRSLRDNESLSRY